MFKTTKAVSYLRLKRWRSNNAKENIMKEPFSKQLLNHSLKALVLTLLLIIPTANSSAQSKGNWLKIDDFESPKALNSWTLYDAQNETQPKIENPQVTEVREEHLNGQETNRYLLKKAGPDGIFGNRKALSFRKLPKAIEVGEIYTLYLRLNVESYANNHVLGLSNMPADEIKKLAYEAFEPSLRITDRFDPHVKEKNNGAMQVRNNPWYDVVYNKKEGRKVNPFETGTWYEIWVIVNNNKKSDGGQRYDVYVKGGSEFPTQQKVYTGADFRIKRELPLIYFQSTCNSGPIDEPFGNGGLKYDDLYMIKGLNLTSPLSIP